MDSSADHSGSHSAESGTEGTVPSTDATHAAPSHDAAAEAVKAAETEAKAAEGKAVEAEGPVEAVAASAQDASEPARSDAANEIPETVKAEAKGEAAQEILEPVKAQSAKQSSELVKAKSAGSDIAATKPGPGSALIRLPVAERFDARQEAADPPQAANADRRKGRFVLYGSQVAVLAFLLGCGYVVAGQIFRGDSKPEAVATAEAGKSEGKPGAGKPEAAPKTAALAAPAAPANAAPPSEALDRAERVELRHRTQEMAEEIRSLKASLDQLRTSVSQSQGAEEIHNLKKGLDGVKSGIETSKTEASASIAQLTAKLEHMQREQAARIQQVLEKAERLEQHPSAAPLTTASLPVPTPAATPPAKPQQSAALPQPPAKPQQTAALVPPAQANATPADAQKKTPSSISNWVVRDVYEGIALVEGPGGAFEVMEGENIPGVGTVKSIERRGTGWVVVTNHGNVDYARD